MRAQSRPGSRVEVRPRVEQAARKRRRLAARVSMRAMIARSWAGTALRLQSKRDGRGGGPAPRALDVDGRRLADVSGRAGGAAAHQRDSQAIDPAGFCTVPAV